MDDNTPRLGLRSISSLFSDTWKIYKERWSVLIEIVLLPTLITVLGYVIIGLHLGFIFSCLGGIILFAGWIIFIFSVLPVIFSIHHVAEVDASYKATIGLFWPFVWITIIEGFALAGGLFMIIVPGIWLAFAFLLVAYVFVIEHRRGIDALRQSKDYIKGYWWAVTGRILLLALLFLVVTLIIEIPITFIAGRTMGSIVSMVLALFFVPFSAIYHYVIFENLRERKPELASAQTKEGTGFIKASAIVGIVVPILVVLMLVILAGMGAFYMMGNGGRYAPPPGYNTPAPFQQ